MTVWNSGELTVDKPMSEELCEKIHKLFDCYPGVHVEGQSIAFSDTPDFRLNTSTELQDLLAEYGISIQKDSSVKYYGDYEGYYVWTGSKFESMDYEEYTLYALTDEALCNMVKARGYSVRKERNVYSVDITSEETPRLVVITGTNVLPEPLLVENYDGRFVKIYMDAVQGWQEGDAEWHDFVEPILHQAGYRIRHLSCAVLDEFGATCDEIEPDGTNR